MTEIKFVIQSLERKKINSCLGKTRFNNSKDAKEFVNLNLKDSWLDKKKKYELRPICCIYECNFCNLWHIGHKKNIKV